MQPDDLIGKVDHLLQKPLSGRHSQFLRWVREKARNGDLIQFDHDYILYLWDEFGPSYDARKAAQDGTAATPEKPEPEAAPRPNKSVNENAESKRYQSPVDAELEQSKQTIGRLREAGKRAVAQRDHWEAVAKA